MPVLQVESVNRPSVDMSIRFDFNACKGDNCDQNNGYCNIAKKGHKVMVGLSALNLEQTIRSINAKSTTSVIFNPENHKMFHEC